VFMQATSTAANVVKQMIPFQSQQSMAEESVVSAFSENVTQSEEYLRLQEEREQLAREKDVKESQLQEMTQQFDNMLRRNSMLQEQGMKTNVEMKTKLRVLK
jgi:LPS O-antigen subunit length determinant protein (WzzB/FepE family)